MAPVLRDVTLRDGLQDEPVVPTDQKLAIFEALVTAGVRDLELTSFVRPDRVPAMADAEALCRRTEGADVTRWGLVLNQRGADRALDAGLRHLQFVVSVSDTHSRANAGRSTDEALEGLAAICDGVGPEVQVEATLATAFGCPYEHRVPPRRVVDLAVRSEALGAGAVNLADTIGTGLPSEVRSLVAEVEREVAVPVGAHLHDTRGLGIANALAAIDAGAVRIDGAVGGLGGCPFAPGASGNVAIEDLAHLLDESGHDTGMRIPELLAAATLACESVGRPITSSVGVAGPRFSTEHAAPGV